MTKHGKQFCCVGAFIISYLVWERQASLFSVTFKQFLIHL